MIILVSCLALKLSYSGCCKLSLSPQCFHNECYCEQHCHKWNNCCSDVVDIGCHPTTSTGKTYQYKCLQQNEIQRAQSVHKTFNILIIFILLWTISVYYYYLIHDNDAYIRLCLEKEH